MSKHTPDWEFVRHADDSRWLGNIIGNYGDRCIRTIACLTRYGDPEEQEANVRLMAAATKMYDALKLVQPLVASLTPEADIAVRKALAFAEGGAA
jgi:hypothetical protein